MFGTKLLVRTNHYPDFSKSKPTTVRCYQLHRLPLRPHEPLQAILGWQRLLLVRLAAFESDSAGSAMQESDDSSSDGSDSSSESEDEPATTSSA
jgi:hypothetical protein